MLPFDHGEVRLTEFKPRHIAELQQWVPDLNQRLLWGGSEYAVRDLKSRLKKDLRLAQKSGARFLIRVLHNKQAVGHVQLVNLDRRNHCAHLARVLVRPDLRGQGLGLAMVRASMACAFEVLALHRLSLFVYESNRPALQMYKKAGFLEEGLLRDRTRLGRKYLSSIAMAILEDEYRALS